MKALKQSKKLSNPKPSTKTNRKHTPLKKTTTNEKKLSPKTPPSKQNKN